MYLAREWEQEFREYKEDELKYNEAIYDNVTDRQFSVIQKYFRWRTRVRFREIVKDTSLQTLPKKAKSMANIIGDEEDWVYDGCVDTGYFGGGQCELGHALRYEHYAISPSTGREIIFGIKCVSDFFGIDPKRLRGISKVQDEILEEIKIIVFIMETDKHNQYIQKYYPDLMKVIKALKPNADELFERDWSNQIAKFLQARLPLTPSLVDRFRWVKNKYYDKIQKQVEFMSLFEENEKDVIKSAIESIGNSPITYAAKMALNAIEKDYNYSVGDKKILILVGAAAETTYDKYVNNGFGVSRLERISKMNISIEDKQKLNMYLFAILGGHMRLKNAGMSDDIFYGNKLDILLRSTNKMREALTWVDRGGLESIEEEAEDIIEEEISGIEKKLELIYENRHKNRDHWAVGIALDIRNKVKHRGIKISEKQENVVNVAYEVLELGNVKEVAGIQIAEDPCAIRFNDNKHKLDMINNSKDSRLPFNKFVFKVIDTINKTNRITDKQMKYVEEAYKIVIENYPQTTVKHEDENIDNTKDKATEEQQDVVVGEGGKAAISIPSITEISGILGKGLLEGRD